MLPIYSLGTVYLPRCFLRILIFFRGAACIVDVFVVIWPSLLFGSHVFLDLDVQTLLKPSFLFGSLHPLAANSKPSKP